jgi:hypothetical protein
VLSLAEQPDDEGALAALVANHAQLAAAAAGGGVILSARPHRVRSKIHAIIAVSGRAGMNTSAY